MSDLVCQKGRDFRLLNEDTLWIARKNVYGLRRGLTIQPSENDKHSTLTFVPINQAAGVWN